MVFHFRDLPPTEDAFSLHVKRAFLQCAIYKSASKIQPQVPKPTDFGYYIENNVLVPRMTPQEAKPSFLEITANCKCKLFTCTNKCKCLKTNVPCNISCLCQGKCGAQ